MVQYQQATPVHHNHFKITTMVELKERMAQAMALAKASTADLAKAMGVSYQAVKKVLDGKTAMLTAENNRKAAKFMGVDSGWLASGEGAPRPAGTPSRSGEFIDLEDNPDYPAIKYVNFKLSAGASGFGVDYDAETHRILVFGRDWYESRNLDPEKLFAVKVANGSMEPGLYDKDTVVVNTADTALKDGQVFAMNFEGELVIKRMVRDGGRWWLASDNADQLRYPRKICDENVFPIGKIVHKQSERI